MSRKKAARGFLVIVFAAAITGPILAIDWRSAGSVNEVLYDFGRVTALMGFVVLALQVVLTCRWKLLDRLFAIDRITNFHKLMGVLAACLLTAHVALIIAGSQNPALLSMNTSWRVNLGKAALVLLWITATLAFTFEIFGLDYNVWRISHKTALAIVLLGFLHSRFIGRDLQNPNLRMFWWILLVTAITAASFRNIYIPLFGRKRYRIESVWRQTHDTFTLTFKPVGKAIRPHKPGQFMFLKLKRRGGKSELHPFTIASSPTSLPQLQATIKQSGNYTKTIDQTTTSDTARVEGPYGQFSVLNYPAAPLLFIGGGVGITPLMSMMRYLRDTHDSRQVIFLYGNKTREDMIFEDELNHLPDNFSVVHILSRAGDEWSGLKGYITKDMIGEHAGAVLEKAEIFLCGPPPMMDKVVLYLKQLSIPPRRIHYERFTI